MTTRKKTNRRVRKTSRGHQMSTSGKISPPLDVRSPSDLSKFKDRIMKGPITIVMVYADWCGHCHEMRPHFDAAAKSPNRTMQAIAVNEKMLDKVNNSINQNINHNAKPIEVEGYPSILLVDREGNKVSDIEPVKNTSVMTKVMTEPTSPMAESSPAEESSPMEESQKGSFHMNSYLGKNNGMAGNSMKSMNAYVGEDQLKGSIASTMKGNLKNHNNLSIQPVSPSEAKSDRLVAPTKGVVGGSLFGALSQSAYTLAPAAVLLATAAAMMNRRKSSKKSSKKSKVHGKKKGTRKHRK